MTCLEELQESGILETACGGYIFADDTGYFSVGEVRGESMNIVYSRDRCCMEIVGRVEFPGWSPACRVPSYHSPMAY